MHKPDTPLLKNNRHIVPCFFRGEADFKTDAMPPIPLLNNPSPVPTKVPSHIQ